MAFSIFLSCASLIFLLILIMTFYSKELINKTSNKIFRLLIILCLCFVITEILSLVVSKYINSEILTLIIFRLHCGIGFAWLGILYIYATSKYKDYKEETILQTITSSNMSLISSIGILLVLIVVLFMPYNTLDASNLNFIPKELLILSIPYFIIISVIIMIMILKKNDKKLKKSFIFIIIFNLIGLTLQIIFNNISFIPFVYVFIIYMMYFILENPDLTILEEISSSQEDIEKSNQAKTDFLSNMSYEIKIPMNLIVNLCNKLNNMKEFNSSEVKEDIKQIVDASNNLLETINNILDISKIESGKEVLTETDYNVIDIVSNVINVAKQKIGSKPVKLVINIDKATSSVLHGDSSKLYQSLLNIVINAAKYTEVGRITIELSSSRSGGSEHLLFKVSDTGIGIKDEDKNKVFLKGEKLSNGLDYEVDGAGLGLGLTITKIYIESMGGKIWFETQYRVGSSFFIEVDQKIVDATPLGNLALSSNKEVQIKPDCSNFKVLIVDDNLLNIRVAKRLLASYKMQVESVTSGKECINRIKEENKYDAIFMDHMMPEMDGIETLHALKKLEGYTIPPVIALTANAIAGMKEMYLSEGFDDYLAKPINIHELDRIINKFFKK